MPYDPGWLNKGTKYTMHTRENALNDWLKTTLNHTPFTVTPLAGDASFRRYYRLHSDGVNRVIMDAPPGKETLAPFVSIAQVLAKNGIHTPAVHAVDYAQGFAILEDLGDRLLLGELTPEKADALYQLAIKTIVKIQNTPVSDPLLPDFDKAFMLGEINLFREWFLGAYLNITLDAQDDLLLKNTFDWLTTQIENQPQVFIHRDYHSRNLIVTDHSLGVIDFQDAMRGPYTYDLVSLLKDCYIQWPREKILQWLGYFYDNSDREVGFSDFTREFDLCGLQRHLKVLGIFCRLHLRDNKPAYINDLPLTFNYVMSCLEDHEALQPFYHFMQQKIQQPFLQKNKS